VGLPFSFVHGVFCILSRIADRPDNGSPRVRSCTNGTTWLCLAAFLAEDEIDRVCGDLPKLGLISEGAFEHGQSARDGDKV